MHHRVEGWGLALSFIVLAAAVLHVVEACFHRHDFYAPTLMICVVGPAVLGALHGFASQLEAVRLRERSTSMVELLEHQDVKIRDLLDSMKSSGTPQEAEWVWGLSNEVLATASLMMDETASWSLLYRNSGIHPG